MIPRLSTVKTREAPNGVQITTPPYLDPRINPAGLMFDEHDPDHSRLSAQDPRKVVTLSVMTPPDKYPKKMHFIRYRALGEGTYGTVWLAQNQDTGEWVAMKTALIPPTQTEFLSEVKGLKAAKTLVGYDLKERVTIMRLMPGFDLKYALVHHRDTDEPSSPQHVSMLQKLATAKDVLKRAAGMHKDVEAAKKLATLKEAPEMQDEHAYRAAQNKVMLESVRMIHRDIKPENMLYDPATNTIMFCDYGMAHTLPLLSDMQEVTQDDARTVGSVQDIALMGTYGYFAPEFFQREPAATTYNEASEVYALGMTLADIMGLTRWSSVSRYAHGIGLVKFLCLSRLRGDVPKEMVTLLKEMTHEDPARRPTVIVAAQRVNKILFAQAKKTGLKVCALPIRAFLNASEKKKKQFIEDLIKNKINTVALTALVHDKVSLQEYYQVRYELMKAGIIHISPFMTTGEKQKDNIRVVKDHYDAAYATTHTKVVQYQQGKFIDKTPPARIQKIESPAYATVRDKVNPKDKIFSELNYVMQMAKHISGWKKKDSIVLQNLPQLLTAQDFMPFVRALEDAYLKSLKAGKTLFGPKVTEKVMNDSADNKYALQRTLGLMLKSAYEYMDEIGLSPKEILRGAPRVMSIDDHRERHVKRQAAGAKVKYKHI